MPLSGSNLENALKRCGIEPSRYQHEKAALYTAGFDEDQADSLIFLRGRQDRVSHLLEDIEWFKKHFTLSQIVKIAAKNSGLDNIVAIKKCYSELQTLGFTTEQIVNIAGHVGGYLNINTVKAAYAKLQELGLNAAQIVRIASRTGGSYNIEFMIANYADIKTASLSSEQITTLFCTNKPLLSLQSIKLAATQDITPWDYGDITEEDILYAAAFSGVSLQYKPPTRPDDSQSHGKVESQPKRARMKAS